MLYHVSEQQAKLASMTGLPAGAVGWHLRTWNRIASDMVFKVETQKMTLAGLQHKALNAYQSVSLRLTVPSQPEGFTLVLMKHRSSIFSMQNYTTPASPKLDLRDEPLSRWKD